MSIFRNLFTSSIVTVYVSKNDPENKRMLVKSEADLAKIQGGADYRIKRIAEKAFKEKNEVKTDPETGAHGTRKWVEIHKGDFDDGIRVNASNPNQPPVIVYCHQKTHKYKLRETDKQKIQSGAKYQVKTLSDWSWKRVKTEAIAEEVFYDTIVPSPTESKESINRTRVSVVVEEVEAPAEKKPPSTQLSLFQRISSYFKNRSKKKMVSQAETDRMNKAADKAFLDFHQNKISALKAKYHITEISQLEKAIERLENRIAKHDENVAKLARMKETLADQETAKPMVTEIDLSSTKEPLSVRVKKQQARVDAFEANQARLSELKSDLADWRAREAAIASLKQGK